MNATPSQIDAAAALLRAGELVAFPTETVYGLGADATNDRAVARVYEAKGRPQFNPLITHVADLKAAEELGEFGEHAQKLAARFWPGPLTLVVPRWTDCAVSRLASAGLGSIAIRVPRHPLAQALLKAAAVPIVGPSANPSGGLSPTTADHVSAGLGDRVSMILDGGAAPIGVESTIVGLYDDVARFLRVGGIAREEIEDVIGRRLFVPLPRGAPHAPGQLESHYAPRAQLRLNAKAPRAGESWLGFGRSSVFGRNLSAKGDLVEAAAALFDHLHQLDAQGAEVIAVAPIPNRGIGVAINDRLKRAAAPRT